MSVACSQRSHSLSLSSLFFFLSASRLKLTRGFLPLLLFLGVGVTFVLVCLFSFGVGGGFLSTRSISTTLLCFVSTKLDKSTTTCGFCLLLRFTWRRFGYNRKACRPASGGALFSYSCDSVGVGLKQTLQTFDLILGFGEFSMYVAVDTTQLT